MRRLAVSVALVATAVLALTGIANAQTGPQFRSSFKALADLIPNVVGTPLEEEHWDIEGNIVQRSTNGMLVWRRSDRWTAFTNGGMTWILGPYGLASRSNSQLFPWEFVPLSPFSQPAATPAPGAPPAPSAPAPTAAPAAPARPTATPVPVQSYVPDVKAMDDESGAPGTMVKSFLLTVDGEWSRVWGWRPHKPTTVYLYINGGRMASGLTQILGNPPLTGDDFDRFAATAAVARGNDLLTGGWAILVNLGYRSGMEGWDATIQALVLHEYAYIMETDLAGDAGPQWYREGFAEWAAYARVPGTAAEQSVVGYAASYYRNGTLPSLSTLNSSWNSFAGASAQNSEAAYGAAFLAVKYLTGQVGGMPVRQVLERTAAGESFESALQTATGYTIGRLDSEYKGIIPSS